MATATNPALPAAHDRAILDVALALGADPRITARLEIGVPCPGCGGTDRFSVNHGKNLFYCRASSAGGDPIDLVRHVNGCDFRQAVEWLTGSVIPQRPKPMNVTSDEYRQKARERGYRIWRNGYPMGKVIAGYFAIRRIPLPTWRVRTLREADKLFYWDWSKERREFEVVHEGPAMICAITGPDGRFIGAHRTWMDLNRPGGKAEIFSPETGEQLASKKVEGSVKGGKIVLREGAAGDNRIVIGEGIETCLAWDAMYGDGQALWSAVSLGNLAGRSAGKVMHPTMRIAGDRRPALVGDGEPIPGDDSCLHAEGDIVLLGDSDGDLFSTRLAMERASKRLGGARIEWAPTGMDFADELRLRNSKPADALTSSGL